MSPSDRQEGAVDREEQVEYLAKRLKIPADEAHILLENMESTTDD